MHPQNGSRGRTQRSFIISQRRLVRGPDFAENRPAGLHDFRHPKSTANLNKLTARNHYLPADSATQVLQHQDQRRRTVIDHTDGLSPRERRQQMIHQGGAAPAIPGF